MARLSAEQQERWLATYTDVEGEMQAMETLKQALPVAADTIVGIVRDTTVHPRLRYDAARYVLDFGLRKEAEEEPFKEMLDAIRDDIEVEDVASGGE